MLTSTYTLVTLSVEQTAVRAALHALAETLRALPDADSLVVSPPHAAGLCKRMREVHHACHWRKLDKFLIPALRCRDEATDVLLHELEQLSGEAERAVIAAEACLAAAEHGEPINGAAFSYAVRRCIAALRRRLEREEDELFPLARSIVGGEAWFAIANQMLAHDAHARERRGESAPGPLRWHAAGLDVNPLGADPVRRFNGLLAAH